MFKKGLIYSSNYYGSINKPVYLFLAEVYLGNMKKLKIPMKPGEKIADKYDSVKACGYNTHLKS